jgi:hypothetical protein
MPPGHPRENPFPTAMRTDKPCENAFSIEARLARPREKSFRTAMAPLWPRYDREAFALHFPVI